MKDFFERETIEFAVIGAFALHAYGYVDENTADVIFRSAQKKRVSADLELPVAGPEHLILLKLFAVQNEPARKLRELADIREIYRIAPVDKTVLLGYFKRYGLEEYFEDVTRA